MSKCPFVIRTVTTRLDLNEPQSESDNCAVNRLHFSATSQAAKFLGLAIGKVAITVVPASDLSSNLPPS